MIAPDYIDTPEYLREEVAELREQVATLTKERDAARKVVDRMTPTPPHPDTVEVSRAWLAALEAIAEKIERLDLGPDGRAWTPLQYREFARGELRAALRAQAQPATNETRG